MLDLPVQETKNGPDIPASQLAEKYLQEGKDTIRLELPRQRYEEYEYRKKRLLGIFGTKKTVKLERIEWTELVQAWPLYPNSAMGSEHLFARYLAEDGRVFDNDIDFGWEQVSPYIEYDGPDY